MKLNVKPGLTKSFNLLLFFSLFSLSIASSHKTLEGTERVINESKENIETSRNGRLFSFPFYGFQRVGFASVLGGGSRCIVDEGDNIKERHGVCLLGSKCRQMSGTPMNNGCDSKFGFSCCIFNATCNRQRQTITVKRDKTYIFHKQNEEECLTDYKFPRQTNVCQLRLEFKKFNISPPNNGTCLDDKFSIKKAENLEDNMEICGKANETDHLYLHYGESNEIVIHLDIARSSTTGDVDVLVEQIKCNSNDIAPEGCTQYFTQQRGDVRSFNFDPNTGLQLNNHVYAVCIKGNEGSKRVTWSRCNGLESEFDIVTHNPSDPTMPSPWSTTCQGDSITIPGSPLAKYCINFPASGVLTTAKPYIMYVNFNAFERLLIPTPIGNTPGCPPEYDPVPPDQCVLKPNGPQPDIGNRGFCLRYQRV